jgi:hypothetical protein
MRGCAQKANMKGLCRRHYQNQWARENYRGRRRNIIKQRCREWKKNNREYMRQYNKQYRAEHKRAIQKQRSWYTKTHKNERRTYRKNQLKFNIAYKLGECLRKRLWDALNRNLKNGKKQKTVSAVKDLGCSISQFKKYIEKRFKPGMNWNNYGFGNNKWHIDHIRPLSSFNLSNLVEAKQAIHYTKLQPLWQTENLHKHNFWEK